MLTDASLEASLQQSNISPLNRLPSSTIVKEHLDLLARAIENILHGAFKYNPQQSDITIELANDAVYQQVSTKIMDRGSGAPEEELESVFLALYCRTSKSQQFQEHGLGLAIARQIMRSH
ncbi:sensor histidine kinase [Undibacterium macrobrachii]|uniref:histidine kinase n=1 Tax=Undibacterium macrobrachii TaxID=1119058 RepID=A0ABQ2XLE4_9BURK|nr:ATP-binding protein [Undibacterium macrobrachii]GGX22314.1 hypothetical protein GCM10011282_30450 [Undibacterium macrobrachii]